MNLESIANLLTKAESEEPTVELLESLKSASVDIKDEVHQRTLERNRFWKTATDIRANAKTRTAAKDGHGDLEMVLATLESAASEIAKSTDRVQSGIGKVARDKSRQTLDAHREAVVKRIKADWDVHVDALAGLLSELSEVEKATHVHNVTHKDDVEPVESLLGRPAWTGMVSTAPLRKIDVQRVDATQPLRGL